jgi:ABC-type transport system substrate-binding protein
VIRQLLPSPPTPPLIPPLKVRGGRGELPSPTIHLLLICLLLQSLLLPLILLSCSSEARLEGYVYFRLNANPTTLDPGLIVDVPSATIAAKLFNGLVRLDENLNIVPDIAERWNISPDGKVYTFFLRRGVKFLNGREVVAQDFKYSFERILSPHFRSPNTWVLEKIEGAEDYMRGRAGSVKGIEVMDKRILRLKLKEPFSAFLSLLTMTPCYVVPREEAEKPDFSTNPSGTGPYKLKKWLHNNEIILDRREDYFEGGEVSRFY